MQFKWLVSALSLLLGSAAAQPSPSPPARFRPVTVRDLSNNPVVTPCVAEGKRVTMIIYADPDHYRQNEYFVDRIKKYKFPLDEFCGYGVVNLKDTVMPNFMLRFILRTIRGRSEQERKAIILADPDHTLPRSWNLGDCNNKVVVILLDRNGDLLFWKAGALDEAETTRFIGLITSRLSHYSLHPDK